MEDGRAEKKNALEKIPVGEIPLSFLHSIVRVLMWAHAVKGYQWGDWRKGHPYMTNLNACIRHLFAFIGGRDNDPESGLSHLWHAACQIMFVVHNHEKYGKALDDRPVTSTVVETVD